MRILSLVCAVTFSAGLARTQTFAEVQAKRPVIVSTRVQLVAQMESAPIMVGMPIVLKLRLKNVSSRAVVVADNNVGIDYEFTVTDTSGKEPPRTASGISILRGEVSLFHTGSLELAFLEETERSIDLRELYQLTSPGGYYVRATFRAITPEKKIAAVSDAADAAKLPIEKAFSNPVQFAIVP